MTIVRSIDETCFFEYHHSGGGGGAPANLGGIIGGVVGGIVLFLILIVIAVMKSKQKKRKQEQIVWPFIGGSFVIPSYLPFDGVSLLKNNDELT